MIDYYALHKDGSSFFQSSEGVATSPVGEMIRHLNAPDHFRFERKNCRICKQVEAEYRERNRIFDVSEMD